MPEPITALQPGEWACLLRHAHSWDASQIRYTLAIPRKTNMTVLEVGSVNVKVQDPTTGAEAWVHPRDLMPLRQLSFSMLEGEVFKEVEVESTQPDAEEVRP